MPLYDHENIKNNIKKELYHYENATMRYIRLGVNIDHIATLRNARGGIHPDPIRALKILEDSGADGVTIHLREDRRHIHDRDVELIIKQSVLPVNLEMAANREMVNIACTLQPNAVCIVPENRAEVTTEGGLAVAGQESNLAPLIRQLKSKNIRVSLFIDPQKHEIEAAGNVGADIVELHTGRYCDASQNTQGKELRKLVESSKLANKFGIEVHAGHGLNFENVAPIAAISELKELNIGHFIIGESVFHGLKNVIMEMQQIINECR